MVDSFYVHIQGLHWMDIYFRKRRTNESSLESRIPRWSGTFLGWRCCLVIVTMPVHLSLAGTNLLILGGPERPPCQQAAPLGSNLSLMNKHIWDLAHVMGSLLRNLCHLEYKFFLGSLASTKLRLPGISGLWCQHQVAYLQQLSASTSPPLWLSLCEVRLEGVRNADAGGLKCWAENLYPWIDHSVCILPSISY